ncbi:pyruvate dehydrogenase complex dihydrolipoamide acetyltransferase [Candidatus Bandiella numerosa]|uniref:pyruvate dehydrogenase complex dihydrolipoamide acetyltransferase n=1 Tax=Candidatus Bandiella numerosa TaxID=2570586 RepID=UPI00249E284F|nr:pyruvate dehydrogenase complex dihydrolipoamide acetyltransferase [Candidatus Bandiella numerosa]WHA05033.1 pyruvate dehydrogenase complex dihydrolipoamide acetyltransferase [Candidatus Bandiella numerosa]
MVIEVLMPALSPTMKEGNLAKWLKNEGDTVEAGDVIAEIETDKAIMEVEAVDEGILAKILVEAGTKNVKVNDLIAIIAEEGEEIKDAIGKIQNSSIKEEHAIQNNKTEISVDIEAKKAYETLNHNKVKNKVEDEPNRVFASPLAKRIAEQENINISSIQGSGPRGRIVKSDVENAIMHSSSQNFETNIIPNRDLEIPVTNMRKIIAERLVESKQQVPHFYLDIECFVDKILDFRSDINSSAKLDESDKPEFKISINDILIKACALALFKNPKVNSAWYGDKIIQFGNVDISVAVAIDDGLMTPIVRNANQKSLIQISNEVKELAKKAKSQKLKPEEYQGGGFTISNLGMYSIKSFYAIINPPQSCILSIGGTREIPAYGKSGNLEKKQVMNISLSCDHRVVDGATAAIFLSTFKRFVENPSLMICY